MNIMPDKLHRVSVAVDEKTRSILESLAKKENKTLSEIIRQAIMVYSKIRDKLVVENIDKYLDIVSSNNIVLDIELWLTILDELNKCSSQDFWNAIERIGMEHGFELRSKGVKDIDDLLNLLSLRHLFEVNKNRNSYTLVLATRNEAKLLKAYLKGLFKSLGVEREIEIVEGLRKLIILKKAK